MKWENSGWLPYHYAISINSLFFTLRWVVSELNMPSMYPQMPDALVYFCSLESPACEKVVNRKKIRDQLIANTLIYQTLIYGSTGVTNPHINAQGQFRNASAHNATVAKKKILGVRHWHIQWWNAWQGGREPLEGVFIHHACSLPQNILPRFWKDKELSSSVVTDHEYIEWTNDGCLQTWIPTTCTVPSFPKFC